MPLTAETEALLQARAEAGLPELHTLSAPQARDQMRQMREAMGPIEPEAVARVEDRSIPGPAGEIAVRIYWPGGEGPHPLLVFFHGGGWVIGDLDSHDGTCRSLTNAAGCVVVAVDYRLAPEHRYPAAPEDCFAATRWAVDHADELGADASRVAVAGDSAGANLAAVVALMARDRGGPALGSQLLAYPVTDHGFGTASYKANGGGSYGLSDGAMRWFWDLYLDADEDGAQPYASPLRAEDLSGLPRALVITAQYDPLRDEGEAYAQRLTAAGTPTTYTCYEGVVHGFLGQAAAVPEGRQAIEQIAAELAAAFAS